MNKSILICYEKWSEEDVEFGEPGETGIHDEWEIEEDQDENLIEMVVNIFYEAGICEASNSCFTPNIWYISYNEDYKTGIKTNKSFHLHGFTQEEEQEIYNLLKTKKII